MPCLHGTSQLKSGKLLLNSSQSERAEQVPQTAQDPYLAVVLDFTASRVADLTYAKKFADKNTWNRRVGVYIAPWLLDQGDHGAPFAESVCKHFYAIEMVSTKRLTHNSSFPLQASTLPLTMGARKTVTSSAILSSPSHMVHFFSYRTQP